jgi:hypothetical protein
MLDALTICWPYKRWARFDCPLCDGHGWILPGYDVVAIGGLDRTADAAFAPTDRFEVDEYSSHWSSAGLRITIAGRRWTTKAAEALW